MSIFVVHENPVSLGFGRTTTPGKLLPNMFFSDEPGFYKDNQFGIRLETILRTVLKTSKDSPFGLEFLILTLNAFESFEFPFLFRRLYLFRPCFPRSIRAESNWLQLDVSETTRMVGQLQFKCSKQSWIFVEGIHNCIPTMSKLVKQIPFFLNRHQITLRLLSGFWSEPRISSTHRHKMKSFEKTLSFESINSLCILLEHFQYSSVLMRWINGGILDA